MNIPFVDLNRQYASMKQEIDSAVQSVLSDSAFIGGRNNKFVAKFENDWAQYLGAKHVAGCANGTDALEMVLEAMNIGPGDEVIVPAMTWISTAEAVCRTGARPVFVDVHPQYYTLDPAKLQNAITQRTKAIIPVHLYGLPAEMSEILDIAASKGLYVIEDAAQAHGAIYQGQKVGTLGDAAIFSFYPGKNLGAFGDAGCVVTNSDGLAEQVRRIGNHGQVKKHDFKRLGRNSRMDGIQAAVLSVKLSSLDEATRLRQEVALAYWGKLRDDLLRLPECPDYSSHAFHLFVVQANDRGRLKEGLAQKGIQTGVHYPSRLWELEFLAGQESNQSDFQVAQSICEHGLSLPMFPGMTQDELDVVVTACNEILDNEL